MRFFVVDDAAVGRDVYLAVSKGIQGIQCLVGPAPGSKVYYILPFLAVLSAPAFPSRWLSGWSHAEELIINLSAKPAFRTKSFITNSAIVERQILP